MRKIMVRVPTTGTRRRLRSGQTGCRRSVRNRTKPNATKRNRRKKPESFAKYDQALEDLKKRKRKPEESSTTDNEVNDNAANERREQPIRGATNKALIDIGKVYRHEKLTRSKLDIELGITSDEDSKFDLYIPPKPKDDIRSEGSSVASSQSTVMTAPKTTLAITLPTLPPLRENDFNEDSNIGINNEVTGDDTPKGNDEVCFDSFLEQGSDTTSLPNSITDEMNDLDSFTKEDHNEKKSYGTSSTTYITRSKRNNNAKSTSVRNSIMDPIDGSNSNDRDENILGISTKTDTNTRNKKKESSTNEKMDTIVTKKIEYQYHKIKKISDVYASFELPKSTRSCIPTLKDLRNEVELKEKNANKWQGLINMSSKCVDQTLRAICPGPSRTNLKLDIAKKIIKNDEIGEGTHNNKPNYEKITQKVIHTLFTMLKNSKHATIEKRILRSIVAKTFKRGMVQSKCNEYGLMDFTSGSIVAKINEDYESLMNGITLQKKVQTKSRINHQIITEAVSYILHKDHIITTSWGEREYELSKDEKITLPRLCRKQSPLNLWNSYAATNKKQNKVGRTTFYYMIKDLTSSNRDIVSSVDYVQALLVAEPVEMLQEVVDTLVHTTDKELLSRYIAATATFLKSRYQKHVLITDDDSVTHDVNFVLGRLSTYDNSVQTCPKSKITCPQCMFPYFVCERIKECIPTTGTNQSQVEDATNVLKECQRKFKLYMSHKARCTNQNFAIDEIHAKMKQKCTESNGRNIIALMIGDFKMKFEPMSQRETTLDHYGKRGISWHGFCLQFYLIQKEKNKDGDDGEVTSKYTVYLDQVVSDGNKQDSLSVYSLLDAALGQIANELPFISSIILQTDNAKSYNNTFLLCAIPLLNIAYASEGLRIIEFIHTETQDGKTILDAHFARMMKFIRHFMSTSVENQVKKINTPSTLGYALSHNGGVRNVGVQVVNSNIVETKKIEDKFNAVTKILKTYFTQVNHAYFYSSTTDDTQWSDTSTPITDLIDAMVFNIGVQSYSNINRIVNFHVDMSKPNNKDMVIPDKLLLDEVNKKDMVNHNKTLVQGNDFLLLSAMLM